MPEVKVYGTSTCPWCIRTREFLKNNNIPFTDIDVSSDDKAAEEMVERSGQMGVPVLDIGGQIIVGFDEQRIRQALSI